tara:strand:- start:22848 stop:23030 length:183 start_codon:yes stop_codon:yes gene_type:complete
MSKHNKYVERAKRIEKRVNNYSSDAESLILEGLDFIEDLFKELINPKKTEVNKKKGAKAP